MAAIIVAELAATGSPSTRRFQTLLDGKIAHAESGGTGAGVGPAVGPGVGWGRAVGRGVGWFVGCAVGALVGLAVAAEVAAVEASVFPRGPRDAGAVGAPVPPRRASA